MSFSRRIMHIRRGPRLGDEPRNYINENQLTREEHEEIAQILNTVHDDFIKWAAPDSWTSNSDDMYRLRNLLGSVEPVGLQIDKMSDHEVAWGISKTPSSQAGFCSTRVGDQGSD